MSRLTPEVIALDKGINLQTAKIIAPKGSVLDSLNYEQVDFQGQKRIEGFARYDGNPAAALDDYLVIVLDNIFDDDFEDSLDGTILGNANYVPFGVVASSVVDYDTEQTALYIAVTSPSAVPAVGETPTLLQDGDDTIWDTVAGEVIAVSQGVDLGVTPDEHYEELLEINNFVRGRVTALPGPIAGLHWFRDRLYAVANVVAVSLTASEVRARPKDYIYFAEVRGGGEVLASYLMDDNTELVFVGVIDSYDISVWATPGLTVYTRNAVGGIQNERTIAASYHPMIEELDMASFYESRSDEQVFTEANAEEQEGTTDDYSWVFGWRFRHLGWRVPYESGISLYGSLPSLNQNITGLGVQGPTSVSGNNGKPASLTQNVAVAGQPPQVNGWKSSQTPTSYDLDIDNISDIDDVFIYADAFLSWDEDSTAISSPGLTTSTLEARDASASVNIEVAA